MRRKRMQRCNVITHSCLSLNLGSSVLFHGIPCEAEHETTLAWVCVAPEKSVGYVQYTSLENDEDELHVLITSLSVEDSHRCRGFARGLISSVVSRMLHCRNLGSCSGSEHCCVVPLFPVRFCDEKKASGFFLEDSHTEEIS